MTRSRNNNIFAYSKYRSVWSRILFHDHGGRGMEKMRKKYEIPSHIKTIEVDLTGIGGTNWDSISEIHIRCHSGSDFSKLCGTLPDITLEEMKTHFSKPVINTLLHVDLLRYIDFNKFDLWNNGGATLNLIVKEFPTLDYYWSEQVLAGGGPGLLCSDVEEDWQECSKKWEEEIRKILP